MRRPAVVLGAAATVAAAMLALPASSLAHGTDVPPEPSVAGLLFGWSFDPTIWIPLLVTAGAYLWAVRRVDAAHPGNRIPTDRVVAWLGGLAAIAVALQSGLERWDTTLFSLHMVQHLVLIFIAAPLLVLGAPITLLLRVASPGARRRWILPVLDSRVVRVVGHPLIAMLVFGVIMWGSHVSPLFEAALENVAVHDFEHVLYLASAILFFMPVIGRDPSPYRMAYPARLGYLLLQMPLNSFLGVVILNSTQVLYPHYAVTGRLWGPPPIDDQQLAGAVMWGGGDLGFLVAIMLVIAAWMRFEEARTRREEARDDARAATATTPAATAATAATAGAPGAPTATAATATATAQANGGIGASR